MVEIHTADDDYLIKRVLGTFDVPAYVKRGLKLESEERALLGHCRVLRDQKLLRVRLAVIACWQTVERIEGFLSSCESSADYEQLLTLADLVSSERKALARRPASPGQIRRRLMQLTQEAQGFNQVWQRMLEAVDLGPLNQMIADYNKFAMLERECAMRSARLAAHGFQTRQPWTRADLELQFPPLPVPRLRL